MNKDIPYIAHESEMARMERHTKRLWIALVITIVLMFATNAYWIYEWIQYDYTSTSDIEIKADGDSNANYIGEDGTIYNGSVDTSAEN